MNGRRRFRNNAASGERPVRLAGREYPVIGRMRIRRQTYLLLKEIGGPGRTRYMAFDPNARGELRLILVLPCSESSMQFAGVLKRLPTGNRALPRLLNFDRQGDALRMVLTWIAGITLSEFLQRVRAGQAHKVSAYESVRLLRGLAHGLRTLHNHAQIAHADLTPKNLILTRKGSQLAMIDFGSAWFLENTRFREPGDGLTPVYAAPELHMEDQPANVLCDQFSASVILYELLTGEIPYANYGGKAGRAEFAGRLQKSYQPPSQRHEDCRTIPEGLWRGIDRVVEIGLALDPNQRYPTTQAWLDELEGLYLEMRYRGRRRKKSHSRWSRFLAWLAKHGRVEIRDVEPP